MNFDPVVFDRDLVIVSGTVALVPPAVDDSTDFIRPSSEPLVQVTLEYEGVAPPPPAPPWGDWPAHYTEGPTPAASRGYLMPGSRFSLALPFHRDMPTRWVRSMRLTVEYYGDTRTYSYYRYRKVFRFEAL
ncbi:hypothetical protein B1759_17175 [Rubrivirga sp. SAORIC476]|nr:hypothetical protein B1759_17175 [Rubrivirga sp. SAORIC476]